MPVKSKTLDFGFDNGCNLACVTLKAEKKLLAKEIYPHDAELHGCCGKESFERQKSCALKYLIFLCAVLNY